MRYIFNRSISGQKSVTIVYILSTFLNKDSNDTEVCMVLIFRPKYCMIKIICIGKINIML